MKKPDVKKLQAQCDEWNKANPIGTDVILTRDDKSELLTATRSVAQVQGSQAVIWIERISGCYKLDRVRVRKCRVCGCTTFHACIERLDEFQPGASYPVPCHWVEDDLCSACVGKAVPA